MTSEVMQRVGLMKATVKQISRRVLSNPEVDLVGKRRVVEALLLSRVLFQSGVWPHLTAAEYEHLHAVIMNVYKRCLGEFARALDAGEVEWRNNDAVVTEYGGRAPWVMLVATLSLIHI